MDSMERKSMNIKKGLAIFCLAAIAFISCQKNNEAISYTVKEMATSTKVDSGNFVKYSIFSGQQYCDNTTFVPVKYQQLAFQVKFDSSAVYQTAKKSNQDDINKLFGFSDNNAQHHEYSARFGWRWSNSSLHLFGYIYNHGSMSFVELGTVEIGIVNSCSIKVEKDRYLFTLNGTETSMPRESTTTLAEGYKLFPYFGGDESAPHNIFIWIKEL
jgi:hypothetical protein